MRVEFSMKFKHNLREILIENEIEIYWKGFCSERTKLIWKLIQNDDLHFRGKKGTHLVRWGGCGMVRGIAIRREEAMVWSGGSLKSR